MTQPLKNKSKKICLMGASGVGKTSLVKRFVEGKFDETYRTTIGVHIDKKSVICDEQHVELIIWDLEGKDDLRSEYPSTYLGGAQGYMLVADVTRPETLEVAKGLLSTIMRHRKNKREKDEPFSTEGLEDDKPPFVLLLNKQDLIQQDPMQSSRVSERPQQSLGYDVKPFNTSAKLDKHVDQAFTYLVRQMLEVDRPRSPFDELFRASDSLVLERSTEGHTFRSIHTVPEWGRSLIDPVSGQPSRGLWIVRSHFLKDYVSRAKPWWDQHQGGASDSEPWEEAGPSGTGLDLEVVAIAIGTRKLLVIKRLAPSLRAYKQRMQENRLNLHQRSSEL